MDVGALEQATKGLKEVLEKANALTRSSAGLDKVLNTPGAIFCPAIPVYSQLLRELGMNSFEKLDEELKKASGVLEQEVIEAFWNAEDAWNESLDKIDTMVAPMEKVEIVSKVGDKAPVSFKLQNARNPEEVVTLKEALIAANSTKVHLVLLRHLS